MNVLWQYRKLSCLQPSCVSDKSFYVSKLNNNTNTATTTFSDDVLYI